VVGVDVGGTWLRVAAGDGGRPAVALVLRSSREPALLASRLRGLWRRVGWTRDRVAALVVASRGVWTPGERAVLARSLRGLARRVRVVPDAEAAHRAALADRPGVLLELLGEVVPARRLGAVLPQRHPHFQSVLKHKG